MYGFPKTTAYVILLKIIADNMQKLIFHKMFLEFQAGLLPPCELRYREVVTNLFGQDSFNRQYQNKPKKKEFCFLGPFLVNLTSGFLTSFQEPMQMAFPVQFSYCYSGL